MNRQRRFPQRLAGWLGIALAAPFFAWFLVGFLPGVPGIVDVFGIAGLRTPASITVTGLLLAAVGFWDY